MWVPLVENNEFKSDGADYFVKQHMHNIFSHSKDIDTLLLACTHYPLLKDKIMKFLPANVTLISQGEIVAASLAAYLERHPEMERNCSKNNKQQFFTTDSAPDFDNHATIFFGKEIQSKQVFL